MYIYTYEYVAQLLLRNSTKATEQTTFRNVIYNNPRCLYTAFYLTRRFAFNDVERAPQSVGNDSTSAWVSSQTQPYRAEKDKLDKLVSSRN